MCETQDIFILKGMSETNALFGTIITVHLSGSQGHLIFVAGNM